MRENAHAAGFIVVSFSSAFRVVHQGVSEIAGCDDQIQPIVPPRHSQRGYFSRREAVQLAPIQREADVVWAVGVHQLYGALGFIVRR
jgi:hypothetical protein